MRSQFLGGHFSLAQRAGTPKGNLYFTVLFCRCQRCFPRIFRLFCVWKMKASFLYQRGKDAFFVFSARPSGCMRRLSVLTIYDFLPKPSMASAFSEAAPKGAHLLGLSGVSFLPLSIFLSKIYKALLLRRAAPMGVKFS